MLERRREEVQRRKVVRKEDEKIDRDKQLDDNVPGPAIEDMGSDLASLRNSGNPNDFESSSRSNHSAGLANTTGKRSGLRISGEIL